MIWLMTSITFFYCTWEEFHTESLDLPVINGVNEGCYLACGIMILTAVLGQGIWLNKIEIFQHTYQYNQLLIYISFYSSLIFTLMW
jgi:hypothetical protein